MLPAVSTFWLSGSQNLGLKCVKFSSMSQSILFAPFPTFQIPSVPPAEEKRKRLGSKPAVLRIKRRLNSTWLTPELGFMRVFGKTKIRNYQKKWYKTCSFWVNPHFTRSHDRRPRLWLLTLFNYWSSVVKIR